jgi:hypothetical protein
MLNIHKSDKEVKMTVKRVLFTVLVASVMLLAVGIGPSVGNPARALPESSAEPARATIAYAGRLSDEAGKPVADGAYDLSFTLYGAVSGGEPLWLEVQRGVVVSKGEFLTTLGSVAPISATALSGQNRWLAVSVRGPGETKFTVLNPRQQLSAAVPAAPTSPTANGACPHDHLGEMWTGDSGPSGNGLRVENTWTDGYGVTGVAHSGVNAHGVLGWTTSGTGVKGQSATGTGVKGESADGYGIFAHSDNNHSIYVDGSGNSALYISSAGASGVYVSSAGSAGVGVYSAGAMGMWVHSATYDGILVDTAGWDGVHVTGPVGGLYYGSGKKGDEDFSVLNTGEVRSKVGFATPTHGFAENMAVEGTKADYVPGDVLVAASTGKGAVALSSSAYSRAVIGVYSTSPAYVGGQPVPKDQQASGVPVTILGMVLCKVSAENGAIRPGDLLVTSSTPGYAMRADRDSTPPGTILGKALESLDSGTGLIQVLVTLQ